MNLCSCLFSEKWECGIPQSPVNGFVVGTDYSSGATVHVRCDEGYYLVGTSVMTCLAVPGPFNKHTQWDPAEERICKSKYVSHCRPVIYVL